MSILDILKFDHRKTDELLKHITKSKGDRRKVFFDQLKQELREHTELEEDYFYPELEEHALTQERTFHSYEEHEEVEDLLEALESQEMESREWDDLFDQLRDSVQHHVEEEENDLFLKAKQVLGEDRLNEIGDQVLKRKQKKYKSLLEKLKDFFSTP